MTRRGPGTEGRGTEVAPVTSANCRDGIHEEARETLEFLQACSQTINVVLVALTDGVELEIWADGSLRRRSRFLRDTQARKYSDRLAARLSRRGYRRGKPGDLGA